MVDLSVCKCLQYTSFTFNITLEYERNYGLLELFSRLSNNNFINPEQIIILCKLIWEFQFVLQTELCLTRIKKFTQKYFFLNTAVKSPLIKFSNNFIIIFTIKNTKNLFIVKKEVSLIFSVISHSSYVSVAVRNI